MSELGRSAPIAELDDEARALHLEQTKAESRQAIAEAQRSAVEAWLPKLKSSPIEGKAEFGYKAGQLAEVAAFNALAHAAQEVASRIATDAAEHTVCIVNSDEMWKSDFAFHHVESGLQRYKTAIENLRAELARGRPGAVAAPTPDRGLASASVVSAALALPAAAVSATVDLIGMFRSDYQFSSREVTKDQSALLSAIVAKLNAAQTPVAVAIQDFRRVGDDLFKRLSTIQEQRDTLETLMIRTELAEAAPLRREIDELNGAIDRLEAARAGGGLLSELSEKTERLRRLCAQLPPIEVAVQQARSTIASFDAFVALVTAVPTKGYPLIIAAARQAQLIGKDAPFLLCPNVVSIGGETITRHRFFGTSIRFFGTAVVSYLLLDPDTGYVRGGTSRAACEIRYNSFRNRVGRITTQSLT